jgi:alkylated DNA nucleotide flippase Atl1
MAKNTDTNIPCHRVVKSDGSIGEYNGLRTDVSGSEAKKQLLQKEGVIFSKSEKVVFNQL